MIPGEILLGDGDIEINPGREVLALTVRNTGDRPVQVGSHFHFAESNEALDFDRAAAWGHRLAVPAGTSVRFEPGIPRDVSLVALAGARVVPGLRALAAGPLDKPATDGTPSAGGTPSDPATAVPPGTASSLPLNPPLSADKSDLSDSSGVSRTGEHQAAGDHETARDDGPAQPENGSLR